MNDIVFCDGQMLSVIMIVVKCYNVTQWLLCFFLEETKAKDVSQEKANLEMAEVAAPPPANETSTPEVSEPTTETKEEAEEEEESDEDIL